MVSPSLVRNRYLDLLYNQDRLSLPDSIGGLTRLEYFNGYNSMLNGTLPSSMGNMSSLRLVQ